MVSQTVEHLDILRVGHFFSFMESLPKKVQTNEPVVTFVIRGTLRMLSIIQKSKLLRLFLLLTPNQQGSPIGLVYADDIAKAVFIYVLWIAFSTSPFGEWTVNQWTVRDNKESGP